MSHVSMHLLQTKQKNRSFLTFCYRAACKSEKDRVYTDRANITHTHVELECL